MYPKHPEFSATKIQIRKAIAYLKKPAPFLSHPLLMDWFPTHNTIIREGGGERESDFFLLATIFYVL